MSPSDPSDTHGTILIVEDEEAVRDVLSSALKCAGYDVVTAADVETALQWFEARASAATLLVLDANLDGVPSREVFRSVRRRRPDLPVLVVSGAREDDALAQLAEDDGRSPAGCSFLGKPFTVAALEKKVAGILGR